MKVNRISVLEKEKEHLLNRLKLINEEIIFLEEWHKRYGNNYESKLTEKEYEVCILIKSKKSTDEIAEEMVVTKHTVKKHISNILRKLNLKSRYEIYDLNI